MWPDEGVQAEARGFYFNTSATTQHPFVVSSRLQSRDANGEKFLTASALTNSELKYWNTRSPCCVDCVEY